MYFKSNESAVPLFWGLESSSSKLWCYKKYPDDKWEVRLDKTIRQDVEVSKLPTSNISAVNRNVTDRQWTKVFIYRHIEVSNNKTNILKCNEVLDPKTELGFTSFTYHSSLRDVGYVKKKSLKEFRNGTLKCWSSELIPTIYFTIYHISATYKTRPPFLNLPLNTGFMSN